MRLGLFSRIKSQTFKVNCQFVYVHFELVISKNVLQFLSITAHHLILSNWEFQYSHYLYGFYCVCERKTNSTYETVSVHVSIYTQLQKESIHFVYSRVLKM